MKTQIVILKLESWSFKPKDSEKELSGTSAVYLLEDFELQRTTVKDDILHQLQKTKLPALFEVDIKPIQKYNNGRQQLKYELNSVKLLNEVKVF